MYRWAQYSKKSNMKKTFYSHIIEVHHVSMEIEESNMSEKEKKHLDKLFESSVHTSVMDHILMSLPEEDHERFLKRAHEQNHEGVWEVLGLVPNIEEIIKTAAHAIRNEFLKDIREDKKKRPNK